MHIQSVASVAGNPIPIPQPSAILLLSVRIGELLGVLLGCCVEVDFVDLLDCVVEEEVDVLFTCGALLVNPLGATFDNEETLRV